MFKSLCIFPFKLTNRNQAVLYHHACDALLIF